jgi:5-methylcytosine-specific restriction endonuclease McrA
MRRHGLAERIIQRAPFDDKRRSEYSELKRRISCRWCGEAMPKRRRSWCGDACAEEWLVRRSPAFASAKVFSRDRGVCSSCGFDSLLMRRVLAHAGRSLRTKTPLCELQALGFNYSGPMWETDHIVPVVEGGGGCGLDNLRTLCVPCHKLETALLAKRRAEAKRRGHMP